VAGCHHRLGRHASATATNLPALITTSFSKDFFAFLLIALIAFLLIALIEGTSRLFSRLILPLGSVVFSTKTGVDIIWYTSAHTLASMSVPCSFQDFKPIKGENASLPPGVGAAVLRK
jgi:hypothetical protein